MRELHPGTLASIIASALANRQAEPFFGTTIDQKESTQTAFTHDGRRFLIINPADLQRIAVHFDAASTRNPLLTSHMRPFMGLPIRDLDNDSEARAEFWLAFTEASKAEG